jgi:LmbE family N-acetylglucosaminyl deacetylase
VTGLAVPGRALAVGAHPDDVELYAGATLASWTASGCEVHILVCTDGSKGSWDVDEDPSRLVATRRDEQHAAVERLGATGEVAFLDRVDGELDTDRATAHEVAAWIRRDPTCSSATTRGGAGGFTPTTGRRASSSPTVWWPPATRTS